MGTSPAHCPARKARLRLRGAENLPEGFTDTLPADTSTQGIFASTPSSKAKGRRCCWSTAGETWYQYRLVCLSWPRIEVIAVDQRGIGLSDKPQDGYDIGTLAADLVALMDWLGHQRFARSASTAGCLSPMRWLRITRSGSTGWSSGGLRPRHDALTGPVRPGRRRAAFAPRLQPARHGERESRQGTGRHLLRRGFAAWAGTTARGGRQVLRRPPRFRPRALRGSFELYRALGVDFAQSEERKTPRLRIRLRDRRNGSIGDQVADTMKLVATTCRA